MIIYKMIQNILLTISGVGVIGAIIFKIGKYLSREELKKSLDELEKIIDRTDEIERLIKEHKELIEDFGGKINLDKKNI